jgi:hypothetical protein
MAYHHLVNLGYKSDHEIPFSHDEIIAMLLEDGQLKEGSVNSFKSFCKIVKSIYHFEFHDQLEKLKKSYRVFNPDLQDVEDDKTARSKKLSSVLSSIDSLMIKANYNEVSEQNIERALVAESIIPVSLEINFEEFETYKVYYQGQSNGKSKINSIIPFLKKEVEYEYYNRVVFLFKVKELSYLNSKTKNSSILRPGKVYLKYLRNIPKLDLEMIFPNPKPKMNLIDKVQIWVPLILGIGIPLKGFIYDPYILKSVASPFEEGISVPVLGFLFALFGFSFKTYSKYKFQILSLQREIAESLYFKDIGNNEAVLTSLVDVAEEEEVKEVILAYYFLLNSSNTLSSAQLDEKIERWMKNSHNTIIDFDVSDGLRKLESLNILNCVDAQNYSVPNLNDTLKILDRSWDNYFQHS